MAEKNPSKNLVDESLRTKKTRKKLKKHFEAIDKAITPQALKRKSLEIHRWIARHASERIVLKAKSISLFDENQNTAKLSQKVSKLAGNLQEKL